MSAPASSLYEFGDFRMDTAERLLSRRDGTAVPLTPRVFETLRYLVEHSGTVLDKERLMEAVWPDSIVEENNLSQNISTLRRAFGETPGSQRYIVTVPGRGYRFVADVKECDCQPPEAETRKVEHGTVSAPASQPSLTAAAPSQALPRGRGHLGQLIATGAIVALLSFTAFFFLHGRSRRPAESSARSEAPALVTLEKSIAVLPFENLSDDKENSYFAAGIQDDVLTSLAQIRELKVISRTSAMAYQKPDGRNMREIGQALGVANVLEGSVRRTGNRVLVSVQLIDARNDRHIWAARYDRTVADSIGLQGELATQIAAALKATLAPEEKARLEVEPTSNSEAYVLYLTALGKEATDEITAEQLYMQATALDPKFALAHARAALLNSRIGSNQEPRARKAKARAQAEEALRLSPTLGEAHMALGLCLYWGEKKYDAALEEFEVAAATSPNNADIYTYVGGIYRRQGRWREAVASFERALSLDPRNARIVFRSAINHLFMRDWPAAAAGYKRALEITPDDPDPKISLAYLEVVQNNNPAAGRNILQSIPPGIDPDGIVTEARWDLAMLERNYASAEKILADYRGEKLLPDPKTFYQGRTALARGDIESAQRYFAAAMPVIEGRVRDDPDDPQTHRDVALLYAYLHRKEDALREGRRAIELEPGSPNAFHVVLYAANLALVYALVGEKDEAITLIERLLTTPGAVQDLDSPQNITLAELRLRWEWDSLRSNPRFEKILAGPEPKTVLTASQQIAPAAPE
jgi:TolB-like protein/DNA-binding winged helix-turn-helix (wHTH) protein/Flp pilus assembly protein TadD